MQHSEWEALALNDCPVSEELIGQLYRSSQEGIHELVAGLSASRRGSLAAFCYGRAHLRDIGLAIAATCDLETLVAVGGRAGNFLFDQSRELSSVEKRRSCSKKRGRSRSSMTYAGWGRPLPAMTPCPACTCINTKPAEHFCRRAAIIVNSAAPVRPRTAALLR